MTGTFRRHLINIIALGAIGLAGCAGSPEPPPPEPVADPEPMAVWTFQDSLEVGMVFSGQSLPPEYRYDYELTLINQSPNALLFKSFDVLLVDAADEEVARHSQPTPIRLDPGRWYVWKGSLYLGHEMGNRVAGCTVDRLMLEVEPVPVSDTALEDSAAVTEPELEPATEPGEGL